MGGIPEPTVLVRPGPEKSRTVENTAVSPELPDAGSTVYVGCTRLALSIANSELA